MPRLIQDLEGEAELTQYALNGHTPSWSGRAAYQALLLPGPRSEVIVALNGQTGVLNAITARTEPDQTMVQLQPLGKLQFQSADGSEYGDYVWSREIRLTERLFGRASRSDDDMTDPTIITSEEAGGTVGIERNFVQSTVSLEGGASIVHMRRIAPEGAPMGSRLDRQYNPRVRAAYTRDLDRRYSLNLDAGAVYVIPYGTDPYNPMDKNRSNGLFPIVGAQLSLVDVWGVGIASVRRDVTPNLLVAQNTVSDVAQVTAAIPLKYHGELHRRQPKLVAIGNATAMRTQLIDPVDSSVDNSFWIGRLDVGLQYQYSPGIQYALRYEFMIQSHGTDSFGDDVPGFYRNTVFFTFKGRFPQDVAVDVPKRRENAVRSDRKDLMPMGAEPVIPDLTAEPSDDDIR
ncbi:MAG TPA: hypothetical protein VGM39_11325 [Kofleriaceae bacterium]